MDGYPDLHIPSGPRASGAPTVGYTQTVIAEDTLLRLKATWIAPTLLLAVVAAFGFFTLLKYPVAFVDEDWNASRAWSMLHTGRAFASVDSGVYQQYDGYWTYWPYLATLIHAVFIWLFGLSLASVRLASLFFGLVLLVAQYFIARRLYGQRAALMAMTLLSISGPFLLSSHLARHDIIVTALGYGAIALYLTDRRSSLTIKSILAGLAIGLALDIHLNALIFGPIIMTLFLLDYGKNTLRTGRFWGFALGGMLGVLYYISMHILPYPQTFFAIQSLGNGSAYTPAIFTNHPSIWAWSFIFTLEYLDLPLVPALVLAIVFLITRRSRSDIRALALFVMSVLVMAAIVRNKAAFYAILIAPTVPLIVAPYLDNIIQKIGRLTEWTFWRNLAVLSIVIGVGVVNLSAVMRGSDDEYGKTLAYLRQIVPAGSLVYGSPVYWFGLEDTHYVNWEQLVDEQRSIPDGSFTDAVETLKPDYLVIDSFVASYIVDDDQCRANYRNTPCMPKNEFNTVIKEHSTLEGDLTSNTFGDIRIYKMHWEGTGWRGVRGVHKAETVASATLSQPPCVMESGTLYVPKNVRDLEHLFDDHVGQDCGCAACTEGLTRTRVEASRKRQRERFNEVEGVTCNAEMRPAEIRAYCELDASGQSLIKAAMRQLHLSARAYHRILKLSRTIADLAGSERIDVAHLGEAVQNRQRITKWFSVSFPFGCVRMDLK